MIYLVPFSSYSELFVADFNPPHLWPRSNLAVIFGIRKLESLRYRVALFVWSYV